MNEILDSHCVDPHSVRNDQFWDFFGARAAALVSASRLLPAKRLRVSRSCSGSASFLKSTTKVPRNGTPRYRSSRRRREAAGLREIQAKQRRVAR